MCSTRVCVGMEHTCVHMCAHVCMCECSTCIYGVHVCVCVCSTYVCVGMGYVCCIQ